MQKKIEGTVKWPTLKNSKSKFKGTILHKNKSIKFQEYEIITGKDEIEVPVDYVGEIDGKQVKGRVGSEKKWG